MMNANIYFLFNTGNPFRLFCGARRTTVLQSRDVVRYDVVKPSRRRAHVTALADDFRGSLTARASEKGLGVRLWRGTPQPSSQFLEISATPEPIVMYVATDKKKGFWSLAKSHVGHLDESNVE